MTNATATKPLTVHQLRGLRLLGRHPEDYLLVPDTLISEWVFLSLKRRGLVETHRDEFGNAWQRLSESGRVLVGALA